MLLSIFTLSMWNTKQKISDKNISKDIGKALAKKNLRKILEFLPIKRLKFRVFTLRKTEILIMLP